MRKSVPGGTHGPVYNAGGVSVAIEGVGRIHVMLGLY